jgi:hypothetical protein
MRTFSISVDICASTQRVWEVMVDTGRWHEWTPSVTDVKRLETGSFAVGSAVLIRQPKLPPAKWTVTEVDPGRSFTWASVGPGVRVVACHAVVSVGDGSRATLSIEVQGMLGGILWRMTRDITERYVTFEAKGFKARSEKPDFRHGDI